MRDRRIITCRCVPCGYELRKRLLDDIYDAWPDGVDYLPTADLLAALHAFSPEQWARPGRVLTAQGMGRMLVVHFHIFSSRTGARDPRGYWRHQFHDAWRTVLGAA